MPMLRYTPCLLLFCFSTTLLAQSEIDLYNRAYAQLRYQNYSEALALASQAIEIKNDFADAYALRGDCNYYIQSYDQAVADYEKDNSYKTNRSSYSLACTYALSGKADQAFKALEANLSSEYKVRMSIILQDKDLESLHSDPRWEVLTKKDWYTEYEKLIIAADEQTAGDDFGGALLNLTSAIDLEPSNSKAYGNRAIVYLRTDNLSGALEDMDQAIKLNPISVYYGNRGYINNKLRNSQDALADYEKAIALDPTNLVYYDLGIARYVNGNKSGAMDALRKHTSYNDRDQMGFYFSGIIASESEQLPEALTYLNRAINLDSSIPQFYMKRGDVYFLLKRHEDAINDYNTVISLDPSFAEAYYIRGNAKGTMLDKEGACADWRKAVELGFEDSNGYIRDLCN